MRLDESRYKEYPLQWGPSNWGPLTILLSPFSNMNSSCHWSLLTFPSFFATLQIIYKPIGSVLRNCFIFLQFKATHTSLCPSSPSDYARVSSSLSAIFCSLSSQDLMQWVSSFSSTFTFFVGTIPPDFKHVCAFLLSPTDTWNSSHLLSSYPCISPTSNQALTAPFAHLPYNLQLVNSKQDFLDACFWWFLPAFDTWHFSGH